MFVVTLVFAGLLALSLIRIDPATTQWIGLVAVTLALLLFFWSLFGTLLLAHRSANWRRRKKNLGLAVSLRQASFFSILAVTALYLQKFDLLTWWNIGIMVAIVVLLEIFFIGKEKEAAVH